MNIPLYVVIGAVLLVSVREANSQVCSKPADVGILLDASGSIGGKRWPKVVAFTQSLVKSFDVSEERSHVAILLYSTKTSIEAGFNTFQGAALNADNINAKIAAVNYRDWKGLTYIDRGLKKATEELFTRENGMRGKDIRKILILFTDGKQTKDQEEFTPLDKAAQPLKDLGVEIYALGIGSKTAIDVVELQGMASKPENVYTAESFDELEELAFKILRASCGDPTKKPDVVPMRDSTLELI